MLLVAIAGSIISPFVEVHILQIVTWIVTIAAGIMSIINSIKLMKNEKKN